MSNYIYNPDTGELYHYGVKGMRWGVRKKYYNSDGSLNDKGVKKYARKGYAQDSYNMNRTKFGKAYDKVTGAHKLHGDAIYANRSKKANRERAEKYIKEQETTKPRELTPAQKEKLAKTAVKGAQIASKLMTMSIIDDVFYYGAGKKIIKETVKQTGRAAVTAFVMARGGYDIRWLDN